MSKNCVIRWQALHQQLTKKHVRLLAVSKYTEDKKIEALIRAGQQDFAEARAQALRDRSSHYPMVNWHMIGPLQKNKAKYIGRHAAMWHSLCDYDIAEAVAKHVHDRVLPVLIQVNISQEIQKSGVSYAEVPQLLQQLSSLPQLEVIGLMGMAAKNGDAKAAFARLRCLRDEINDEKIRELCMGMSGDWKIAVAEGATMVRLGRTLFASE